MPTSTKLANLDNKAPQCDPTIVSSLLSSVSQFVLHIPAKWACSLFCTILALSTLSSLTLFLLIEVVLTTHSQLG